MVLRKIPQALPQPITSDENWAVSPFRLDECVRVAPPAGTCGMNARQKRNALARAVVKQMKSLLVELKDLEEDIRQLWVEFEQLPTGEKILGCSTKKEFCEKQLGRTPRAVRYMLEGGNHRRGETVSPFTDDSEREQPESELSESEIRELRERYEGLKQEH